MTIVDFSSVQADGGAGCGRSCVSPSSSAHLIRRRGGRSSGAPTRKRWDDSSWARWYGGPCFAHDRSAAIQKPLKAPLPSRALPPF